MQKIPPALSRGMSILSVGIRLLYMKNLIPALSRGMLILGCVLILTGLGWGIRTRLNAPPPPVISDEGAVVLAITAPIRPTDTRPEAAQPTATEPSKAAPSNTPIPTPLPVLKSPATGPTPDLLPVFPGAKKNTTLAPTETPTAQPPENTPLPTPTLTPTPTLPPMAQEPPSRIVAPSIKMDAQVVPMGWEMVDQKGTLVSEWVVPKNAAGWHMNSALPGHQENVVVSGHHNIDGKVFRHVVDLAMGDEITIYAGETPYTYNVTEKYILKEAGMPLEVRKQNAQWIMPGGDERLTLVTCWPYEYPGNSHRVIVVARPEGYTSASRPTLR